MISGILLRYNLHIRIKKTDAAKLQDEYAKLVEGLQNGTDEGNDTDAFMANPRMCSVTSGNSHKAHSPLQSCPTIF